MPAKKRTKKKVGAKTAPRAARKVASPQKRGSRLESLVHKRLIALRKRCPDGIEIERQHPVHLTSGRDVRVDFRLQAAFPHERQNYYIEVQSRTTHSHELIDKIEAVRRDTALKTFRFVHDTPLERTVARELKARGVICYTLKGLDRFLSGIEVGLLGVEHLKKKAMVTRRRRSAPILTRAERALVEKESVKQGTHLREYLRTLLLRIAVPPVIAQCIGSRMP